MKNEKEFKNWIGRSFPNWDIENNKEQLNHYEFMFVAWERCERLYEHRKCEDCSHWTKGEVEPWGRCPCSTHDETRNDFNCKFYDSKKEDL